MKTVLIIEDDTALRENTTELLELASYKVITAQNGKIGIVTAKAETPDLIVCDIMMPEVDGYGVLEELSMHNATMHIPFIFLSAKTEHKEIRKGMNMGADDYLTKPFAEEELLSAIEGRLAKAEILSKIKDGQRSQENGQDDDQSPKNLNQLKNFFCDEGESTTYQKGETIYKRGTHSNSLFLILSGVVKVHTMDENGKELITTLYKADDFLGFTSFEDNMPYSDSATAVEATELVSLSKKYVREILRKSQDISLELVNVLTHNLAEIKGQLVQMAYSSVRQKTANTILHFAEMLNRNPEDPIKISRVDLASTAGIATESLIRTLSEFKKEKIIGVDGRSVCILDMERLKNIR